ncbi:hypothetical protein ACYB9R_01705 [Alcaligenes aquatilis]|uniref:hypothetical protein n=1 Tax=Alcaligenes aquatilis TaxID=323284 RepID=UPI002AA64866|nr:hypothetical protein [Alcaligenes faecalis]
MARKFGILIKVFGSEEYADKFIQEGQLYCQTIRDFKNIKDGDARGDPYEAPSEWMQPDQLSITISGTTADGQPIPPRVLKDLSGPVIMQSNCFDRLNAYCMYAVKIPEFHETYDSEESKQKVQAKLNALLEAQAKLSDKILSFGEHAVLIPTVPAFIDRVCNFAKNLGHGVVHGLVDYFEEENLSGQFTDLQALFMKRKSYEHQSEFRFIFDSIHPEGPLILNIGPLHDLNAMKVKTKDINGMIQMRLRDTD